MSTLVGLAQDITSRTALLAHLYHQAGLEGPTWDEEAPTDFQTGVVHPEEIAEARYALVDSLLDMMRLAMGPREVLKSLISSAPLDFGTMRVVIRHNVANAIPDKESRSFEDLAGAVKLNEQVLTRILRYCMTNGVFREEPNGHVRHTAASAALKRNQLGEALKWSVEIPAFSCSRISEAVETYGLCDAPTRSPFNIAYNNPKTMWDYHKENPEMQRLFSVNMGQDGADPRLAVEHVLSSFDWSALNGGRVVDAGGSSGHVSKLIVGAYPKLRIIVQDFEDTISPAKANLDRKFEGRIEYQAHDFLLPQPVQADAYFYRFIFHNWSDADSVKIIKALKPALKPGARLMIHEIVEGTGNLRQFEHKIYRLRDVQMMALMGGKERTVGDYIDLVTQANAGFQFVAYNKPPTSSMTLMEWIYQPEDDMASW